MSNRKDAWQGMNWIRQSTRLAIYLRDGLSCVYCGTSVEQDDVQLTLDHVKPVSRGGSNSPSNLVTCCHKCNSSRGNRTVQQFAEAVAEYVNHNATADQIIKRVKATSRRMLPRAEARDMLARRGSMAKQIRNGR